MGAFERIPGLLVGVAFPLVYVIVVVSLIEGVLVLARHPFGFRGVLPLRSSDVLRGRSIPVTGGRACGRVGRFQYLLDERGRLLFTGRPGVIRRAYLLRVTASDLAGAIRLEVSAPLSMCLSFLALCAVFLGLAGTALLTDGFSSASIYLLLGAGFIGLSWWYISGDAKRAPAYLDEILEQLGAETEAAEKNTEESLRG
jgi:hypothetical protein